MATRDEIDAFLRCAHAAPPPLVINTEKNRETRYRLGITVDDQKQIIANLTSEDYVKGPEENRDPRFPGDIWVFKRFEFGSVFYVKLQIDASRGPAFLLLVAISCHIDNI